VQEQADVLVADMVTMERRIILQLEKKQRNIETNILHKEFNFTSLLELQIK
jgi:hypothetical protein